MAVIKLIHGPNFSGRSDLLRGAVGHERDDCDRPVGYVGPDIFASFSGLAATVNDEGILSSNGRWQKVISQFGIEMLGHRDLATLSGGEEATCAIAIASALGTRLIALDCAMEQLDVERREKILQTLLRTDTEEILIADNRMSEWRKTDSYERIVTTASESAAQVTGISGNIRLPSVVNEPCSVTLKEVRHRYERSDWVLNGIDLHLEPGAIVHLDGLNGSGKSTLAKILVGAILPSSGKLTAEQVSSEENLASTNNSRYLQQSDGRKFFWSQPGRHFAYHFQHPDAQLFRSTVLEELAAGARRAERSESQVEEIVCTTASAFGLTNKLSSHPVDLPFALRKRVALAATFACCTPWVILDEPTLCQDDEAVTELVNLIKATSETGVGFIVISHSKSFITQLCPQNAMLDNGTLVMREKVSCE